jgi:TRAP-type mannitol/chloroaromatic compound transport system permease large subunit
MDIATISSLVPYGLLLIWAADFIVWKFGKFEKDTLIPIFIITSLVYLLFILMLTSMVNPANSSQVVRYIFSNGTAVLNDGTTIHFQVVT